MTDDSLLPFSLPSGERKKITAAFGGGRISSDGGVMLLALADRRMRIGATRGGLCTGLLKSCALACSPSPAAMKMPTTSIICAVTLR